MDMEPMKVTLHDASTCPTPASSELKIIPSPLSADVEHALVLLYGQEVLRHSIFEHNNFCSGAIFVEHEIKSRRNGEELDQNKYHNDFAAVFA
jgi:hypothetical protein